ncbi:MAG: energy transducer TonB [Vicinamibacteria bacterium]|nr:energy transducer TonB [Vicinamibacteria bacterium]
MARRAVLLLAVAVGSGAANGEETALGVNARIAAIARLTLGATVAEVPARLRSGLADEDASVRAAAARVAHTTAATALLPDLRTALGREPDPEAARELAWALADLDSSSESDAALKAALALPALRSAVARGLIAGRGSRIVPLWTDARGHFDEAPAAVVEGIQDGLHEGLGNLLASFALRDLEQHLFEALLTEPRAGVESAVALAALGAPSSTARTAAYFLLANRGVPPKIDPFAPKAAEGLDERLALHLYEASLGKGTTEPMAGLAAALSGDAGARERALGRYRSARDSIRGLSPDERELLVRTIGGESREISDARDRKFRPGPLAPEGGFTAGAPVVRTFGGYPRGFVGAVIEATGCQGQIGFFDGVEIAYQTGGRAKTATPLKTAFSAKGCGEAARILGLNALSSEGDSRVVSILPERPEFLACVADPTASEGAREALRAGWKIPDPKKVKTVRPVYPASAAERSAQGIVILDIVVRKSGCVSSIRVLRSVDAVLDLAAIDAVSGWRYAPTFQDGVAVPLRVTVTVNFTRQ